MCACVCACVYIGRVVGVIGAFVIGRKIICGDIAYIESIGTESSVENVRGRT
jgi:hypothetical protein